MHRGPEITAPDYTLADDEHREEKDQHSPVNCLNGTPDPDRSCEKYGECSAQHHLPDPEPEPPYLSHSDQDKDGKEDDYRKFRRGISGSAVIKIFPELQIRQFYTNLL